MNNLYRKCSREVDCIIFWCMQFNITHEFVLSINEKRFEQNHCQTSI